MVLNPSAASRGCECSIALCWARTTPSGTRRLSGRGPCRSRHTSSGVATTMATVGMPCRLAAITSSTLMCCSQLVAFPVKFFCSVFWSPGLPGG
ncbi:hypothetical protein BFF78_00655 [Streptomyces fodineus]|uniref:Uncharacterized protein n=1 Tax=Streptomyces fodineus TaxID=1904616 RepID=A0A1D7Y2K7_9ACTN|nr:hypothetical protein BFF78_00655 [Streptomyces fodineus]